MGKLAYSRKLLSEFVQFARENQAWWIVPLVLVLALTGLLIATGQVATPFIYTLF